LIFKIIEWYTLKLLTTLETCLTQWLTKNLINS
jgi:hypothetical protein